MAEIRYLEIREIAESQRKIIRFWWYRNAYVELDDSHLTKYIFLKFRMIDCRHFKK